MSAETSWTPNSTQSDAPKIKKESGLPVKSEMRKNNTDNEALEMRQDEAEGLMGRERRECVAVAAATGLVWSGVGRTGEEVRTGNGFNFLSPLL